jgi:hypothetical protein
MLYYVFTILSIFLFLFIFWRNLKEDYPSDQIFSFSSTILLAILISSILARMYIPLYPFWINLASILTIIFIGTKRYHFRFFEVFEAAVIALSPWISFTYLYKAFSPFNLKLLIEGIIVLFLILIFSYFKNIYKKLSWYRSGKIGFSSLAVLILFFIMKTVVALFWPDVVSFALEAIISGIFAVASLVSLVIIRNS